MGDTMTKATDSRLIFTAIAAIGLSLCSWLPQPSDAAVATAAVEAGSMVEAGRISGGGFSRRRSSSWRSALIQWWAAAAVAAIAAADRIVVADRIDPPRPVIRVELRGQGVTSHCGRESARIDRLLEVRVWPRASRS